MKKIPITVVVITKNEEEKIADCLKSVSWADETVVVDDYSSDNTVNIAKQFTDRVVLRKMDIEGAHRNYAYSLARNGWVLSLDADERVSGRLASELQDLFKSELKDVAYTIPIKTYIGNTWLKYGGWYPAGKVRLFRKDKFRYEEAEVHPRVFIDGTYGFLKNDIIHYSYRDLHDFFQSLNNQTTLEARKWFKERRRIGVLKMCRKTVDRFLRAYVLGQGFRGGWLGLVTSCGNGLYQLMSYAKYREMLEDEKAKEKR